MKSPRLIVLMCLVLGLATGRAADATQPVDYTQRNDSFAPAATVAPVGTIPSPDVAVQNRRVEPAVIARQSAVLGDRRAAVDVRETQDKNILDKSSHRPAALEQTMNPFNHREAPLTSGADAKKPERIARYQDSLTAASAANLARYPAVGRATTAKINRFVFRKNAPDSATAPAAAVTATAVQAGGSLPVK